jgi:ferredoxin
MLAAHSADFRGAERIVMIDNQQYRLDFVKKRIPRVETINFDTAKNVRCASCHACMQACRHPCLARHSPAQQDHLATGVTCTR